jgi:hypothetical protein
MNLHPLNLKLFVVGPAGFDLAVLTGVFNRWIQGHLAPELLIDVADYRHVHHGPGVLLVGHEANYSLDQSGGRLGLLYNRKAPVEGSNHDRLEQAAGAVFAAAQRLEAETVLRFDPSRLQLIVNDRLAVPNTPEAFAVLQPALGAFFERLYGPGASLHHHPADPRQRFTVEIHSPAPASLAALLQRHELEPAHA